MTTAAERPLPPSLVGGILRSLRRGNVSALEDALDRAERASAPGNPLAADVEERLELIGAIASEMRATVRRSCGRVPAEGLEAYLPLLRNLAAGGGALS